MSLNKFTKVKDMDTKESRDQEINEAYDNYYTPWCFFGDELGGHE